VLRRNTREQILLLKEYSSRPRHEHRTLFFYQNGRMCPRRKARVRARCIVTGRLTDLPPLRLVHDRLGPWRLSRASGAPARRTGGGAIMRAIGLASVSLVMITLLVTDADAASNRWCAVYSKRGSENCGYATLDQCRAQVLGLGGWCRPNRSPAPRSGPAALGHPVHRARAEAGIGSQTGGQQSKPRRSAHGAAEGMTRRWVDSGRISQLGFSPHLAADRTVRICSTLKVK
jgi:Protein of unknown function (DUF3551)